MSLPDDKYFIITEIIRNGKTFVYYSNNWEAPSDSDGASQLMSEMESIFEQVEEAMGPIINGEESWPTGRLQVQFPEEHFSEEHFSQDQDNPRVEKPPAPLYVAGELEDLAKKISSGSGNIPKEFKAYANDFVTLKNSYYDEIMNSFRIDKVEYDEEMNSIYVFKLGLWV